MSFGSLMPRSCQNGRDHDTRLAINTERKLLKEEKYGNS